MVATIVLLMIFLYYLPMVAGNEDGQCQWFEKQPQQGLVRQSREDVVLVMNRNQLDGACPDYVEL